MKTISARERIEMLEEENRQLRDRIERLTGKDDRMVARRIFGFTEAEAIIFTTLVHCGQTDMVQLEAAIFSEGDLLRLQDTGQAIRSHVKRMRKKMRGFGIDFETVYGFGYSVTEECRAVARRMLAGRP